jgi:hypothetical protein
MHLTSSLQILMEETSPLLNWVRYGSCSDVGRHIHGEALGGVLHLEDELGVALEVWLAEDDADVTHVGVVDHALVRLRERHGEAGEGSENEVLGEDHLDSWSCVWVWKW